jgi:hypothetical protein
VNVVADKADCETEAQKKEARNKEAKKKRAALAK